jgi:hypothetical protein
LIPAEIERATGQRTFNLAVSAAQAPTTYYLLRHALEQGARPSAIIIEYSPDLLMGSPRESIRNYPVLLEPAELVSLARVARDTKFAAQGLLSMLLPSVLDRFEIREFVARKLATGPSDDGNLTNGMLERNWDLQRGAQFTPDNPRFRGDLTPDDINRLRAEVFWCNRVNRIYIGRTLELAARRHIAVFWLLPPVSPALQRIRDQSGSESKHVAFVQSYLQRYPGLKVIDARFDGFGAELFIDPIHLSGRGALALSRQVGQILTKSTSPAWVQLSAPLKTDGAEAYENLHQSATAIAHAPERPRR